MPPAWLFGESMDRGTPPYTAGNKFVPDGLWKTLWKQWKSPVLRVENFVEKLENHAGVSHSGC